MLTVASLVRTNVGTSQKKSAATATSANPIAATLIRRPGRGLRQIKIQPRIAISTKTETKPPREPVRSNETTGTRTANQSRPFSGSRFRPRKNVGGGNRYHHLHQSRVVVTINVRAERASKIVADPNNPGGVPQELEDGEKAEYKTEDQHGDPHPAPSFNRRIRRKAG